MKHANSPSPIFDFEERHIIGQLLDSLGGLDENKAATYTALVQEAMARLEDLWHTITRFPSCIQSGHLDLPERNADSLVDALLKSDPYTVEIRMPTRAALGQAFSRAKFNFWRLLLRLADLTTEQGPINGDMTEKLKSHEADSLGIILAEEILRSVAMDRGVDREARRRATLLLVRLWEDRVTGTLEKFIPFLASAWTAKSRIKVLYGTMAGTVEMLSLCNEGCDAGFINYFSRPEISENEIAALEEFLFNATTEEISRMRRTMLEQGLKVIKGEDVARIFDVPMTVLHTRATTPEDMLYTFRLREIMARHRQLRDLPGPKRTAEAYVMIYYLGQLGKDPLLDAASQPACSPLGVP